MHSNITCNFTSEIIGNEAKVMTNLILMQNKIKTLVTELQTIRTKALSIGSSEHHVV